MKNRFLFYTVLLLTIVSCSRGPEGDPAKRDDIPESPLSPKQPSDAEYPGSKEIDSLWEAKKDSVKK